MDIKALLNRQAALRGEMETLNASAEDGAFTDEQQDQWDKMKAEKVTLEASVGRAKELQEFERSMKTVPDAAMEAAADAGVEIEGMVTGGEAVIMQDPTRGFGKHGMGEFGCAIFTQATAHVTDPRLQLMAAAGDPTQQMGIATDGGHLVPPMFANSLWERATTGDGSGERIINACQQWTIPFGIESITIPSIVNTSRANGSRNGGYQGFWKDELTQMTATKAETREITLRPQELYVFSFISDKLMRNSSLMEQHLNLSAPKEIRFKIANAIVSGTGGAQPKGFRGASGTVDQAAEDNQPADTITADNIRDMWSRVDSEARMNGFWLHDTSVDKQIAQFTQAIGTGGEPLMTPVGGLSVSPLVTLMGRQLVPSEFAYELGDSGDLMYVDLSAYGLAIRGTIQSAVSMHLKFDFAQTAFRFLIEVDGTQMLDSPITPFTPDGGTTKTTTVSPFVTLAERA